MAFEPQNSLEQSLMKAAADPAHRPQFYRDLVASDFFIIQEGAPPAAGQDGRVTLDEGYELKLRKIDWNGKQVIPVFSSLPRLEAVLKTKASYIALNALEFMKITGGDELMLNPGSEVGKEFTGAEIQSIIDGSIWKPAEKWVAQKPTKVMIGQPANYPKEMVEALTRYFQQTKEVKRAYLVHFFNPEQDEKPHSLVAVETSGDWEQIAGGAALVVQDVPVPDPPVDFMQITGKGGIEDHFKKIKPFYQKKLFGLF